MVLFDSSVHGNLQWFGLQKSKCPGNGFTQNFGLQPTLGYLLGQGDCISQLESQRKSCWILCVCVCVCVFIHVSVCLYVYTFMLYVVSTELASYYLLQFFSQMLQISFLSATSLVFHFIVFLLFSSNFQVSGYMCQVVTWGKCL